MGLYRERTGSWEEQGRSSGGKEHHVSEVASTFHPGALMISSWIELRTASMLPKSLMGEPRRQAS